MTTTIDKASSNSLEDALTSVSILYRISSELSKVEDKTTACNIFVESICKNFAIDLGILVEQNDSKAGYKAVANMGLSNDEMNQLTADEAQSIFDQALHADHPIRLDVHASGIMPASMKHFAIKSALLVPIVSQQGNSHVLLCCRMYDKDFVFTDERVINILATKLSTTLDSIAIKRKLLATQVRLKAQVNEVKDLNIALAHEKADVERQVLERTQQLYEEHARLQSSIDSLDVGLLMTFKDSRIISYNTALPKILRLDKPSKHNQTETTELTMEQMETKLLPTFDLLSAIENCQIKGKTFHVGEIAYNDRILSIFGAPVRVQDSLIIGTIILIQDVTEAKVMERSKDEFFSIASHELRTPLTSIKGNSSLILEYYADILKDPKLKEMVDDVHTSADRLIAIVNDFLDLSRLEQGKVSFVYSPVSVQAVVEGVVEEMQVVLGDKKLYLKMNTASLAAQPDVWADENRLKQVVYNLIGNAAKFTDTGGVTVTAQTKADHVKVLVVDTGRGMSPKSQQLLFHKFQQASSSLLTRDTTRGTGLGLYISKMIVENMGGIVRLEESIEDQGSTFSFTMPIASAQRQASAAAASLAKTRTDSVTGLTTAVR